MTAAVNDTLHKKTASQIDIPSVNIYCHLTLCSRSSLRHFYFRIAVDGFAPLVHAMLFQMVTILQRIPDKCHRTYCHGKNARCMLYFQQFTHRHCFWCQASSAFSFIKVRLQTNLKRIVSSNVFLQVFMMVGLCFTRRLSVCLSVCLSVISFHVITTDLIFKKIIPEMYLCTGDNELIKSWKSPSSGSGLRGPTGFALARVCALRCSCSYSLV